MKDILFYDLTDNGKEEIDRIEQLCNENAKDNYSIVLYRITKQGVVKKGKAILVEYCKYPTMIYLLEKQDTPNPFKPKIFLEKWFQKWLENNDIQDKVLESCKWGKDPNIFKYLGNEPCNIIIQQTFLRHSTFNRVSDYNGILEFPNSDSAQRWIEKKESQPYRILCHGHELCSPDFTIVRCLEPVAF
jgi:hypothetical protein